jgi:hypothetical protein
VRFSGGKVQGRIQEAVQIGGLLKQKAAVPSHPVNPLTVIVGCIIAQIVKNFST